MSVLRDDDTEPGVIHGGVGDEHIEIAGPFLFPARKNAPDVGAEPNANFSWIALTPAPAVRGYLPPTCTTIRVRPRFRRRFNVFRPPALFIRARNPCLFTRLRLRGLYVGFIDRQPDP